MLSLKGAGPRTIILVRESIGFCPSPYTWGWCLFPSLAGGYLFGVEGRKKGSPCCGFSFCVGVILFYFLVIFIRVELLYSIVLVSAVQQRGSAMHAHLSWLFLKTVIYLFSWSRSQLRHKGSFRGRVWTLSCSMWDLFLWPGTEPGPPALGAQS